MTTEEDLIAAIENAKQRMQSAAAEHGIDSAPFNAAYADQIDALAKLGELKRSADQADDS